MRFIIIFVTAVCEFVCYFVISYDGQRKRIFSEVGGVGGGGGGRVEDSAPSFSIF